MNWREAEHNVDYTLLFLFLSAASELSSRGLQSAETNGQMAFPLERVVQVFGCYWGQRSWLLWKFVKVKLSFFLLQHQDPGQEITKPLNYEWSIPVEREVRQKEVSWCFNYDDIWKPWASLLSSKREAFIWLNQVKYIIWIALSKENISKVSFIRLGICKLSVCDSTWSKI